MFPSATPDTRVRATGADRLASDLSCTHVKEVQGVPPVGDLIGPEVGPEEHAQQILFHPTPRDRRACSRDGRPFGLPTFRPGARDRTRRELLNGSCASERRWIVRS